MLDVALFTNLRFSAASGAVTIAFFTLYGFIFLITWRIARRFGGRGLAVVICVVAVVGPLRDSWYMTMFPEWGSYAPGFAPMLATSGHTSCWGSLATD